MKKIIVNFLICMSLITSIPTVNAESDFHDYKQKEVIEMLPNNFGLYEVEEAILNIEDNNNINDLPRKEVEIIMMEYIYKFINNKEMKNAVYSISDLGEKLRVNDNTYFFYFYRVLEVDYDFSFSYRVYDGDKYYITHHVLGDVINDNMPSKEHENIEKKFLYSTREQNETFFYFENDNSFYEIFLDDNNLINIYKMNRIEADAEKAEDLVKSLEYEVERQKSLTAFKEYSYSQVMRERDGMIGARWKLNGTILQYFEEGNNAFALLMNDGNVDEIVIVNFKQLPEKRLLEGDEVTIEAFSEGLMEYETAIGSKKIVPSVKVEKLKIKD